MMVNGKITGCQRNGHSLILCEDCRASDIADCPARTAIIEQSKHMESKPSTYEQVALSIAKLVEKKQIQYGNSFSFSYEVMKVLYPNGMTIEQMSDALVVIRIIDKLFRIANGNKGNEDAFSDIVGYGLLSVVRNKQ